MQKIMSLAMCFINSHYHLRFFYIMSYCQIVTQVESVNYNKKTKRLYASSFLFPLCWLH
ncbi:hypothetical protein XIS1_650013 [Xenorhabdus innexi]|uniref:Uncharacterized protein n=1 Tax=Xenorhabdus innexi TaxID=290109 RepID=A0A1N6N096_9GAMM|nr:hypothetical protein XIS1_650013 [Xenorhabdus innexi]